MSLVEDRQMEPRGALTTVRVLDLSRVLAGPYCTMTLGNLGADVVKVERPGGGDDTRSWGPPFVGGEAAYYLSCNSSKRGVTVDLARAEGRALVRALVARADVLVENYKGGAADAWDLGYDTLAAANPGLIYCSIRGFHPHGPYRDRPGYDFIAQALGGVMSVTGEPDGEPMRVGVAIVDITTGLYAATGILAALHARAASGQGQHVEVNLLDAAAGWLVNLGQSYLATGAVPGRYDNAHPTIVPYQTFKAADGYVAVAVGNDGQWRKLCAAIERPDLAADDHYGTNPQRVELRDTLIPDLATTFAARPVEEWVGRLTAVDVPCGAVNRIDEVFETRGLLGPAMVSTLPHPTAGLVRVVNTPILALRDAGCAAPSAADAGPAHRRGARGVAGHGREGDRALAPGRSGIRMPELPEVQTVASELDARLSGRIIEGVEVVWPRTVGHPSPKELAAALAGQRVEGVGRRAKYIMIALSGGGHLVAHLRMTGRITIEPASTGRDPHTRLMLRLDGGDELRFADTRKFGRFYYVPAGAAMPLPSFATLGPEPLDDDFTAVLLATRITARKGNIKAALLDQRLVAGLGNIYVDEALFRAGIHPRRTLQSLTPEEVERLHEAIIYVLRRAIGSGGTSFSDYRTTWGSLGGYQEELSVFRKTGAPCPRCGTPIERDVVAGRGTHYCPTCQK